MQIKTPCNLCIYFNYLPSMLFCLGICRHIFNDIHSIVIVTVIYLWVLLARWIDILFAWVIPVARSNMTMPLVARHQQRIRTATAIAATMVALPMSNLQTIGQAKVMTVQVNLIFFFGFNFTYFSIALYECELQQEQADDRDER